jgi:hypothetical protein
MKKNPFPTYSVKNVDAIRDSASQACSMLKVLANEDRLMLLCQLTQGEKNVGELEIGHQHQTTDTLPTTHHPQER